MLDLDPRVDLDEIKSLLGINQKFDGTRVRVTGRLDQADGGFADVLPDRLWQVGSRRLFHELLMPTLQRAVAFPEMDDVAMLVGENLHFDMARILDELLEVDSRVVECFFSFGGSGGQAAFQRNVVAGHAHSLASPTGGCLH